MSGRRSLGVVAAMIVVGVVGVATSASAEYRNTALYREDAGAQFVLHHGSCELERTVVNVGFHQDFFREVPGRAQRQVQFGVSIQEFDCLDQFISGSDGFATGDLQFDIRGRLQSTKVTTTLEACATFPAPGACAPFEVSLQFDGVGEVDVDRQHNHISDTDCVINQQLIAKTRAARVTGTLSFTGAGGQERSFAVSSADLGPFGATLFSGYERTYINGDGYECTER